MPQAEHTLSHNEDPRSVTTNMPSDSEYSDEITVFIELSPGDSDLDAFLRDHGMKARKHHGFFNALPEVIQRAMEHPERYVMVTAAAGVLIAALRAYAQTHMRRLIVRKMKTGTTVDATNYTPDELKQLEVLDLLQFDDPKAKKPEA